MNSKQVEIVRQTKTGLDREVYVFTLNPLNYHQFILHEYRVESRATLRSKFKPTGGYKRLRYNGDIFRMFRKDVPINKDIIAAAEQEFINLIEYKEWNIDENNNS